MRKSYKRSNGGHKAQLRKVNRVMRNKGGIYAKGEYERLTRKRIYHTCVVDIQEKNKRVLTESEKNTIWKNIKVNSY